MFDELVAVKCSFSPRQNYFDNLKAIHQDLMVVTQNPSKNLYLNAGFYAEERKRSSIWYSSDLGGWALSALLFVQKQNKLWKNKEIFPNRDNWYISHNFIFLCRILVLLQISVSEPFLGALHLVSIFSFRYRIKSCMSSFMVFSSSPVSLNFPAGVLVSASINDLTVFWWVTDHCWECDHV